MATGAADRRIHPGNERLRKSGDSGKFEVAITAFNPPSSARFITKVGLHPRWFWQHPCLCTYFDRNFHH
jgi:hypothetical protein